MTDILVVCSPGGHFDEARLIMTNVKERHYKFVVHGLRAEVGGGRIIHAPHTDRDWRVLLQLIFAFSCVLRERPKLILSTGSSIAVPFFLVAKIFGVKTVYVESPTRVLTPSLTARIVQYLADRLYVRYESLVPKLRNSVCVKN